MCLLINVAARKTKNPLKDDHVQLERGLFAAHCCSQIICFHSQKSKGCKNWLPVQAVRNKFQLYWQQPNRKAIAQHLIIEDIDQQSDLFAADRLKGLIESWSSVKGFYSLVRPGSHGCWARANAFKEAFISVRFQKKKKKKNDGGLRHKSANMCHLGAADLIYHTCMQLYASFALHCPTKQRTPDYWSIKHQRSQFTFSHCVSS